jgi:hypothetical protein
MVLLDSMRSFFSWALGCLLLGASGCGVKTDPVPYVDVVKAEAPKTEAAKPKEDAETSRTQGPR